MKKHFINLITIPLGAVRLIPVSLSIFRNYKNAVLLNYFGNTTRPSDY